MGIGVAAAAGCSVYAGGYLCLRATALERKLVGNTVLGVIRQTRLQFRRT
jgi:hypothetical protein